jgi:hypothetical protein
MSLLFTTTGDEDDGYDETLIPVDFQQMGQIRDDDLLRILVKPLPAGCNMYVITRQVVVFYCNSHFLVYVS